MGRIAPCSSRRRFQPLTDERGTSESRRGNNANFSDDSDDSDDSDNSDNALYKGGPERSGETRHLSDDPEIRSDFFPDRVFSRANRRQGI